MSSRHSSWGPPEDRGGGECGGQGTGENMQKVQGEGTGGRGEETGGKAQRQRGRKGVGVSGGGALADRVGYDQVG